MEKKIIVLTSLFLFLVASIALAGTVQLPQTGQTKCYSFRYGYSEISCEGSGQDGETRAGMPWPDPRFTVSGDCVTDNLTGLMWPRNGNLDGMKNWYNAIDFANEFKLCEYSDWHLPNINELESLVNANVFDNATWLNGQGFFNVQQSHYWSSTTFASDSDFAWYVNMLNGRVDYYKGTGKNHFYDTYVLPVRSVQAGGSYNYQGIWKTGQTEIYREGDDGELAKGVSWPEPRFAVNGDCVTDNLTGLIWALKYVGVVV